MTWRKYGGSGWNSFGPMIAMMAAQAASEWDDGGRRTRSRRDWKDTARASRRRGRMFGQGELRLALLALINEEPRHGYELIKAIEEMTGGAYAPSPGAVYPTLQMLEEEGLIKQTKPKSDEDDGETSGKKPFKATKAGRAELEDRDDEVEALMERLGAHAERAEKVKEKSPDLFRAMGNLASVLKNRANAGKLDKATIDQIVDIIDEVAKRIERL
ncbi:MAG: PadR family transcriptional regulator [Pseudomonadota bacterium]